MLMHKNTIKTPQTTKQTFSTPIKKKTQTNTPTIANHKPTHKKTTATQLQQFFHASAYHNIEKPQQTIKDKLTSQKKETC